MMSLVEQIVRGIFLPELSSPGQRLRALVWVSLIQGGLVTLLFSVTNPLRVLGLAVAIPCAVAILLSPRLGVYIVAASVIGQWPWGLMRYLLMLVTASSLAGLLLHRKPLFPYNPILVLVGLFTVLVLASTINPLSRVEIWSAAATYIGHFLLVWLFTTQIDSRQAVRMVLRLMLISGVITAVIGLIQARTHFVWPVSTTAAALTLDINRGRIALDLQGWAGLFRIDSITGTPDLLALYLQTLMPFMCFWIVRQQRRIRQLIGLLVLLLLGVVHLLSFTRAALLTTVLVLVLTGWIMDKRRLVVFGPTLALLGFLALMTWSPVRERVLSIITLQSPAGEEEFMNSGRWRLLMLPIGVEMLFTRPVLGMGVDQHDSNWPPSARNLVVDGMGKLSPLHNSYLTAGIEMGLGGLVVLLVLVFISVQRLYWAARRFRLMGEFELFDTARSSLIAFIGIAFAMMMYPVLDSFRYFWLLLGLVSSLVQIEGSLNRTPWGMGPYEIVAAPSAPALRS